MQHSLFDSGQPIELRDYQREGVEAGYQYLRTNDDNPVIVVPTGGGKSPMIATMARDTVELWQGRALVLAHVKELLEQTYGSLRRCAPSLSVGLYSAGLGRRDMRQPVIVAGIQSVYQRGFDLGPFNLVFLDEAQLVPPDGEGMYRTLIADLKTQNPSIRFVGFTATPFRMKSGPICTPDGIFNNICYEVGVRDLIGRGWLSPLVSKNGLTRVDTSSLGRRGGDFIAEEVEALFDVPEVVTDAVAEIIGYTANRKSCLVFTSGETHARHVVTAIEAHGKRCGFVSANTPDHERRKLVADFRNGELPYLVNINVFTIGFDAPNADTVVLLRATDSPGLYYQMVGRGFRLSPDTGKADCLVLDFGGNILRHGPVDRIEAKPRGVGGKSGDAPAKECPKCHSAIAAGYSVCPDCGYEFPSPDRDAHERTATDAGVLSGQESFSEFDVIETYYSEHIKRGDPDAPHSMRVDYVVADGNVGDTKSEWICFEHTGYARQKAESWWAMRSPDPIPATALDAVNAAEGGALARAKRIRVKKVAGEKFERIVAYDLDTIPDAIEAGGERLLSDNYDLNEVPF